MLSGCFEKEKDEEKEENSTFRFEIKNISNNDIYCTIKLYDNNYNILINETWHLNKTWDWKDTYIKVKFGTYHISLFVDKNRTLEKDIEANYDGTINWDFFVDDDKIGILEEST
jgi:hypothetical protein